MGAFLVSITLCAPPKHLLLYTFLLRLQNVGAFLN